MRLLALGALLLSSYLTHSVYAEEAFHLFESPRDLSKGRASVANFVTNESARTNPASLAGSKAKWQLRYLTLNGFVGRNTVKTVNDLSNFKGGDPVDMLSKFEDKFGERQYLRSQLFPLAVRIGGFELSPFVVQDAWLDLRQPVLPEMSWKAEAFSGVNISYGTGFGKNFSVGGTVRPMYRWYAAGDLAFADVMDFLPPSDAKFDDYSPFVSAAAVGVDVGVIWHPSNTFRLGLSVLNVGDSGPLQNYGTEPPPLPQEINLGALYRLALGRWGLDFQLDLQDLANRSDTSMLRKMHMGVEFGRSIFTQDNDVGVALGYNDGYAVGGFFIDIYLMRLEYSNYAVELGRNAGQRPDRRHAVSLQVASTF